MSVCVASLHTRTLEKMRSNGLLNDFLSQSRNAFKFLAVFHRYWSSHAFRCCIYNNNKFTIMYQVYIMVYSYLWNIQVPRDSLYIELSLWILLSSSCCFLNPLITSFPLWSRGEKLKNFRMINSARCTVESHD